MEWCPRHRLQSSHLLPPTLVTRATIWWALPTGPVRPLSSGLGQSLSVRVSNNFTD